jgi:hypothetical protein
MITLSFSFKVYKFFLSGNKVAAKVMKSGPTIQVSEALFWGVGICYRIGFFPTFLLAFLVGFCMRARGGYALSNAIPFL